MVKRTLVALDTITDREAILPLVGDLARGSGAAVRLVHVAPVPASVIEDPGRIVTHADEEMKRLEREWRDFVPTTGRRSVDVSIETICRGDHVPDAYERDHREPVRRSHGVSSCTRRRHQPGRFAGGGRRADTAAVELRRH